MTPEKAKDVLTAAGIYISLATSQYRFTQKARDNKELLAWVEGALPSGSNAQPQVQEAMDTLFGEGMIEWHPTYQEKLNG